MQKTLQPLAILSLIASGIILIFSLLFSFRLFTLISDVIWPRWIYWLYDEPNLLQHLFFRVAALIILISVIGSALIFMYVGLKLIKGKRVKVEFFYAAVGLLFVETIVNTFIFFFFVNISEAIWKFFEYAIGIPRDGISIFGAIENFFGIFILHIVAIVLLVLAVKNKYIINTLPIGSIFEKNLVKTNLIKSSQSLYKECPFCAETVLAKAKLCKHCRSKI
jgi:hypothetical protein